MRTRTRHRTEARAQRHNTLHIVSANVRRSGPAHMSLLQHAFQAGAEIILVQEPCLHWSDTRQLTKFHQAYNTFSPTQSWQENSRVITYIQKNTTEIQATPDPEWVPHPDILSVLLSGIKPKPLRIINLYNVCAGTETARAVIRHFYQHEKIDRLFVMMRDFNLHHED